MSTPIFLSFMCVVLAALGWAALGSWVLLLPGSLHPLTLCAGRGVVVVLSFLAIKMHTSAHAPPTDRRRRWYVRLTGVASGLAAATYVSSLGMIPVGVAAPLHYTAPLFVIAGSAWARRSAPPAYELVGALCCLSGALVLVSHSAAGSTLGVTLALISAALWAVYVATQSGLNPTERYTSAIVGGATMALSALPWTEWHLITASSATFLLAAGFFSSTLPMWWVARASDRLSATTVGLLLLCEPGLATTLAYLTSDQSIDLTKGIGLALITAGAASPLLAQGNRS